jgi:hypothetical protein
MFEIHQDINSALRISLKMRQDSYPKDGLGSATIGRGTRTKDHGTLISLATYPWIEDQAARSVVRGPGKSVLGVLAGPGF